MMPVLWHAGPLFVTMQKPVLQELWYQ